MEREHVGVARAPPGSPVDGTVRARAPSRSLIQVDVVQEMWRRSGGA
jgi:hypothetical protein